MISDRRWGTRNSIWDIDQTSYKENTQVPGAPIALLKCLECDRYRAHEEGDYVCVQCRYPSNLMRNGVYVTWLAANKWKDDIPPADLSRIVLRIC